MSDVHPTVLALPVEGEEFRPIPGFDGYQVSNLARVRSCWWRASNRRVMLPHWHLVERTPAINGNYWTVMLLNDGAKCIRRTLHSLVAEAFIGPRPRGMHVCHYDGDGRNCELSNLRYDTPTGNAADRIRHNTTRRGARCNFAKLTEAAVAEVRRRLALGQFQWQIADDFGVDQSTISDIKRGISWRPAE